ncbi:MAG: acyltransferase family protein [Solirubrobacteraceae bacterium]
MNIKILTFTRFVTAILIVAFHYGRLSFPFNLKEIFPILMQMNITMSYFFVLSGFVLIIAYYNKEITLFQFFKNRFARIYPTFIFIALLVLIASWFKKLTVDFFLVISLIHAWIPGKGTAFNVHSWTVSVEVFFYLLFPFLIYVYKKYKLNSVAFSILTFWLISQIIFYLVITRKINLPYYNSSDIFYLPIFHLNEFLIGNLTGLVFLNKFSYYKNNNGLKIFSLLLLLLILLYFDFGRYSNNGLFAIIFAVLIILLSTSTDKITEFFSKKLFVVLGHLTYGLYLYQYPIGVFLNNERLNVLFKQDLGLTIPFYIKLTTLIIVSFFSYFLIEKPARNYILKK